MVYILEAHASNEWPINNLPEGVSCLNQHVTLQDRQEACQLFQQTYSNLLHTELKIALDGSDNEFIKKYPSWPFRVWIIGKDKDIRFKGMANVDSGYNINLRQIESWLKNYESDEYTPQLQQVLEYTGIEAPLPILQDQFAIPHPIPDAPISVQSLSIIPVAEPPSGERSYETTVIPSVAQEETIKELIAITNEQD